MQQLHLSTGKKEFLETGAACFWQVLVGWGKNYCNRHFLKHTWKMNERRSMELSNYLVSWVVTYLGDLQPTYIGVIIYLLSSMDILVYYIYILMNRFIPDQKFDLVDKNSTANKTHGVFPDP